MIVLGRKFASERKLFFAKFQFRYNNYFNEDFFGQRSKKAMLDIFRWTALIAAVVLIVAVAGGIVVSQQSMKANQDLTSEGGRADKSKNSDQATHWNEWFPDSTSLFNFFLALFTAVLAGVAIYQLTLLMRSERIAAATALAARESAQVASDTLIATQRPWLTVSIEPAGPITWDNGGMQVSYKITIKNIGKSPALSVRHVEGIEADRDFNLKETETGMSRMAEVELMTANIMPDDDRQLIVQMQVPKTTIDEALKSWANKVGGPKLLFMPTLVGTVRYLTPFNETVRHTEFLFEIGYWDPAKQITVTAMDPTSDDTIPQDRVRIRRHMFMDGRID